MDDLSIILLISSSILAIMGLFFVIIIKLALPSAKEWKKTNGIVVRREKNYHFALETIFSKTYRIPDEYPTFTYEVDGITYEKTSRVKQKPGIQPDTAVEVIYDPNDPSKAMINTFIQRGTIFKVIGWFCLTIAAILLFVVLYNHLRFPLFFVHY